MGRVRRYKKYKACDPFSKSNGKSVVDLIHDEPPEIFENKVKRAKQMRQNAWDDPDLQERLLQKEALRTIRNEKQANNGYNKDKKIESKRENETMKEFKQRIKQETRKTLAEEIVKMTTTAQKRKLKLKERSQMKKLKKSGNNSNEEQIDFFSAENGHLRPSDLGGKSTFDSKDSFVFGEQSLKPPDLKSFVDKFAKKTNNNSIINNATTNTVDNLTNTVIDDVDNDCDKDIDEEIEIITKNMKNKKRKSNHNIMYRDDMNGDDCHNHTFNTNTVYNHPATIKTSTTTATNTTSISNHHHLEIDRFKKKVLDAYQILKNKRMK